MDLSDGLLGDLPKILKASGVDGVIEPALIPIPAAVNALFPAEAETWALRGGEDYELLLTMPPDLLVQLQSLGSDHGITFTRIGEIRSRASEVPQVWLRDTGGNLSAVAAGAFDHFGPH